MEGLTEEQIEVLHAEMRSLDKERQSLEEEARRLHPRQGELAVGGAHIEPLIKARSLEGFLSSLRKGFDLDESLRNGIEWGKVVIDWWNGNREYQVHFSHTHHVQFIEDRSRRLSSKLRRGSSRMAKSRREERRRRKSVARRRAEQRQSGYETTLLRMPEGLGFWNLEKGVHEVDIVPYIAGDVNPMADKGELTYELTFYAYKRIGVEEKSYVAPSKTFGHPDFIQEWRSKKARDPNADADYLKSLQPKERQLFLIWDHGDKRKGLQLLECSYHVFGKLLDARIDNSTEKQGWDQFYFPDEDGMSLNLTVTQESGGGYSFNCVTAIDFIPREEPLPKEIAEHGICLDELLIEPGYEELKKIFLGAEVPSEDQDIDDEPEPEPEPKKSKPKLVTAKDFGISQYDTVTYEGKLCKVFKVSGDGTSLTLVRDDDDEVLSAVSPEEVELVKDDEPPKTEAPFDTDDGAGDTAGDTAEPLDDDWDDDWDDDD